MRVIRFLATACAVAAFALGARAGERVDSRGGGTVIVAVAAGSHVEDRVARPALYRSDVEAYFEGTIDGPFCRALLTGLATDAAARGPNVLFARSCDAVSEASSFALTTRDDAGASGVLLAARAYFDLRGVAGPEVAGDREPRADGCLALRFAVVTETTLRPRELRYDHTRWSIEGGFPQPGCADGGSFPSGDVSDEYAAFFGGAGFRKIVERALREANFDATVPFEESLIAYAPTVERLRTQYRTESVATRDGAIVYRFSDRQASIKR